MSAQALSSTFASYVNALEYEVKMLKILVSLRSLTAGSDSAEELFLLEESLARIEESCEAFESHLDEEHQSLKRIVGISKTCREHADRLNAIQESLPKNSKQSEPKKESQPSTVHNEWVELSDIEFEKIPKSTKLRLTLSHTNAMYKLLLELSAKKTKMFKVPPEKMNALVLGKYDEFLSKSIPEHGGKVYLTETEIRSSPVFDNGEATGKALLQTLRAAARLRVFRAGGENTYVLQ